MPTVFVSVLDEDYPNFPAVNPHAATVYYTILVTSRPNNWRAQTAAPLGPRPIQGQKLQTRNVSYIPYRIVVDKQTVILAVMAE